MKKLIIIYGLHFEKMQSQTSLNRLIKLLEEQGFILTEDLQALNISVYKSPNFDDHSKLTHIVINFLSDISKIRYYTLKFD